uniref:Uncharacterized protein n=1 Tax=Mustela putorius furo TaxID=9669 RepID=M3Z403_MUSPF
MFFMLVCGGSRRSGGSTEPPGHTAAGLSGALRNPRGSQVGAGQATWGSSPAPARGLIHRPSRLWLLPVSLPRRARASEGRSGLAARAPASPGLKPHPFHTQGGRGACSPSHLPVAPIPPSPGHQLLSRTPPILQLGADPRPLFWQPPLSRRGSSLQPAPRALRPPAHRVRHPAAAQPAAAPASIPHPSLPRTSPRGPNTNPFPAAPPTARPSRSFPQHDPTSQNPLPKRGGKERPPTYPLPTGSTPPFFGGGGPQAMPHPHTSPWSLSSQPSRSGAQLTQRREGQAGRGKEVVGGEQGWHRPWESRARVAMTTAGSEAAPSGGAVGWGLAEGSKFGTAPWGRLLHRPSPILSFLGKYPSSRTPPPQSIAPSPCSPWCTAGGHPSPPAACGQLPVPYTPAQQLDASTGLTSRLPRDYPLQPAPRPPPPVLSAIPSPLTTSQHLASCPPVRGPGLPWTPLLPPPSPRPHLNSH